MLLNLNWIKYSFLICSLLVGGSAFPQADLIQIGSGSGFSSIRAEVDDSLLYIQGTIPTYLEWDGERFAVSPGNDIFYSVTNPKGELLWSKVYGGGGIERISSSPVLQQGGDLWLFHGNAIDSLNIGGTLYHPKVSSFFSFIGIQQKNGSRLGVFAMESQGPLEISASAWLPGENVFVIAGRAEAPILHGVDTLLKGPANPHGFLLKMDTSFSILSGKVLAGEVRPFDMYLTDEHLYLGANIRDSVHFDNTGIRARIQDFDCLLVSWERVSGQLSWFQLLGGVYDKYGVCLSPGWKSENILVAGDFVGVISDSDGRSFESNGFDPDLFFWEFTSTGEPITGLATGSPGEEQLVDARMDGSILGILIEFMEAAHVFNQEFPAKEEGRHLGIFSVNNVESAKIERIFFGAPAVLGFDLWKWRDEWGLIGGFGEKLLDQDGNVLLEKSGVGQYDYFIWPIKKSSPARPLEEVQLNLYPNPFHDRLTLKIKPSLSKGLLYRVIRMNGQVIKKGNIQHELTTIDLSALDGSGPLVLEISRNGLVLSSQMIINLGN